MTKSNSSNLNSTPEPAPTPEQEAALALLQGGSLDDFHQAVRDAAMARRLIEFLRANPNLEEPPEDH
jgi:hypothetical protein